MSLGLTFRLTWMMVAASGALGFLVGFFVTWPWPLFASPLVLGAFVLGWTGSSVYLLLKSSPIDAMASGLKTVSLLVFVTPYKVYLPTLYGGTVIQGTTGAAMITAGAQGLLFWVTVCTIAAAGLFFVARYFDRLADRIERERLRAGMRTYEF